MKVILWIVVIITSVIAINELFWLGKTDLAPVILGLAIAVGLIAIYLLRKKS
jgi:hypothetical protein